MQNLIKITAIAALLVTLAACGGSAKDSKGDLGDKKAKLEQYKKDKNDLDTKIHALEEEIAKADPNAASVKKLVSVAPVTAQDFIHYIELQGRIDSKNNAYVSPRGAPGQVKAIYVSEGQAVRKGQTLMKLDDAIARQAVTAAEQNVTSVEVAAKLKQSVYERYQNLWKENIGSEVQVLTAKTEAEAAAAQLSAARANANQAREQLGNTNIQAEISGTIDRLNIRVGEVFTGAGADGKPQVTIVNTSNIKAYIPVPENYLARVNTGSPVQIVLPELGNRVISSKISVASKVIDPTTRTFYAEANLPAEKDLRPNQNAIVKIEDYKSANAITVPINVVQSDETGKYLYVAETTNGKTVAKRRIVITGETYGGQMEIRSGLKAGEQIITEGYQTVYDGQAFEAVK
jgi:membrane fusion protein (multidrug efflux system)